MRKINKILIGLILIAIMFLGIGYSAIQNITLDKQFYIGLYLSIL